MRITSLDLEEFRLYQRLTLRIAPSGLRIVGENAAGKSTLVEAIALLATMRSPRTGSDRELIRWTSGRELGFPPYARVIGTVEAIQGNATLEVDLQIDPEGGVLRKSVKINGRSVRAIEAVGRLRVVLFAPEDVALISGPPSGRRRYLDLLCSQIDSQYVRTLARYNRIVEQRNSLLKSLKGAVQQANGSSVANQLSFWNDELVTYGTYLVARRRLICTGLNRKIRQRFDEFSSGGALSIHYRGTIAEDVSDDDLEVFGTHIAQEKIHRAFETVLATTKHDELRRGVSLAGPHRDDFEVLLNGMPVGTYGSRGQQRLAVVALKLAEADQMREETGESPVVLLDDVLSELDEKHRMRLLANASAMGAQLVLTTTDGRMLDQEELRSIPIVRVTPGQIHVAG